MATQGQKKPNLDSVTTINTDGSRFFLYPADVGGLWTKWRRVFGFFLILIYALLPWIPINGNPAVLFDVENRSFHIFGLTLVPQDLWVMFFGITGLGFGLFFITSLLGRLWCGWACPYTVFLDHVFRRIERLVQGDAPARKRLAASKWGPAKFFKKILTHGLYIVCTAAIAHIFISYFIPIPRLYGYMHEGPLEHATAFGIVTFLTLILWFCFGWFREQFCIIMCPYGRLQSALTDDDTVIIGYDEKRGEPRGAKGKAEGDCIDCKRCVNVCPTGIDIRNGLQLECIGCAACIDACDDIMHKVNQPTGLIRYDSMNGLAGTKRRVIRPRIIAYTALGILGLSAFAFTYTRKASPYTTDFTRMRGKPFYADEKFVRNHYQLRFHNKRNQIATFTTSLVDAPEGYTLSGESQLIEVPPQDEITRPVIVIANADTYRGPQTITIRIDVKPGDVSLTEKTEFLGPDPKSLQNSPTPEND